MRKEIIGYIPTPSPSKEGNLKLFSSLLLGGYLEVGSIVNAKT